MGQMEDRAAIATVRAAIDSGITLVDTAQAYRTSEEIVGRALKDGYRDRCFLATKVSRDYSRQGIAAAMEESLRKLDVDHVDLYQIHGWNPQYPVDESMEAMARLREQGKTRFIGVSNFNADRMGQALRAARFHSNQPRYNLFDRGIEAEDIPFCAREGVGILAHSPLAKGLLTGRYAPGHRFPEDDERSRFPRFQGEVFAQYLAAAERLKAVARDRGLSLVQLAVAWLLRLPAVACVLVGAKNPDQVREHAGAAEARFSDDELARIETILKDAPRG
jgi:aryl-alcohol dehydrogenase-like predicted oxidoreductase